MAIIKPNNNTISAITALPAAIATGTVLQTIYGSTLTDYANSGSSYTATGLSASITPSSSSNKVLVIVQQAGHFDNDASDSSRRTNYLALFRDSSEIAGQKQKCSKNFNSKSVPISFSFNSLDTPNTTSEITYSTKAKGDSGGSWTIELNSDSSRSEIILMEIAGW